MVNLLSKNLNCRFKIELKIEHYTIMAKMTKGAVIHYGDSNRGCEVT